MNRLTWLDSWYYAIRSLRLAGAKLVRRLARCWFILPATQRRISCGDWCSTCHPRCLLRGNRAADLLMVTYGRVVLKETAARFDGSIVLFRRASDRQRACVCMCFRPQQQDGPAEWSWSRVRRSQWHSQVFKIRADFRTNLCAIVITPCLLLFVTLRAELNGAVYCYRSCLWRTGGRCLLPR